MQKWALRHRSIQTPPDDDMTARLIYLIEDNPADAAVLVRLIKKITPQATVKVFRDGLEGLNATIRQPPQMLFLDLQLPGLPGEEICRFLRASPTFRKIPLVIASELSDAKRQEMDLLLIGADHYLTKPFQVEEVRRALNGDRALSPLPVRALPVTATTQQESFIQTTLDAAINDTTSGGPPVVDAGGQHPKEFGGYRIIDFIGAGGMGTVYKAEQKSLQRVVALKVIKEGLMRNQHSVDRFEREARIMARLSHPNIVQVYDVGRTSFYCYFSMEFVDGMSLFDIIRTGALDWEGIIRVVAQSCEAITYLHENEIVHRDIKPSNILYSKQKFIKVTDFGISRASLPQDDFGGITTAEAPLLGTSSFMAPEQTANSAASTLSDQYSLALTFWQLFTGKNVGKDPKPIHEIRPDFPESISNVIMQALSLRPEERFTSIREFRKPLVRAIREYAGI